jgi:hypothetical protein
MLTGQMFTQLSEGTALKWENKEVKTKVKLSP